MTYIPCLVDGCIRSWRSKVQGFVRISEERGATMGWTRKEQANHLVPVIESEMGEIRQRLHTGGVSPSESQRLTEKLAYGQQCLDEYRDDQ